MRVAITSRDYPPSSPGGGGVHARNLAFALESYVSVEAHCVGAGRQRAKGHRPPTRLATARAGLRGVAVSADMAADLAHVDIVHTHNWATHLAGVATRRLYGRPHVVAALSLEPSKFWNQSPADTFAAWLERTALEEADAITAISHAIRSDILAAYPQVDASKIYVVWSGVDSQLYRPVRSTRSLRRYGLDEAMPIVVFIGRISPAKGIQSLLEAADYLLPDAQLVLCMGVPESPKELLIMRSAVEELMHRRRGVIWVDGPYNPLHSREILSRASVFVCPSAYEPFGLVVLEAMACGTPVVASDAGGIPEIVVDGVTGTIVPRADDRNGPPAVALAAAVNDLLDSPDRRAYMGANGRERAITQFSWSRVAAETLDVYRHVLGVESPDRSQELHA